MGHHVPFSPVGASGSGLHPSPLSLGTGGDGSRAKVSKGKSEKRSGKLTFAFLAVNNTLAGGLIFDLTVWALAVS